MRVVASCIFAAVSACISRASADDAHIVLKPVNDDASLPEKMLLYIPGGKVPNDNYITTAKAIQASSSHLRLWVVIPGVFQRLCVISCTATSVCAPLHNTAEAALSQASAQGWNRGTDAEDLWLAGHSLGGVCANTMFQAYSAAASPAAPYAGLIVMGSYVDESGAYDLTHYPTPVMTLNVELDGGLARPGKTSTWWMQHAALDAAGDKSVREKPVIILPKLNHSDFCPGFEVPGDLPGEIDQAAAAPIIGEAVAAFLHANTRSVAADVQAGAVALMKEKISWTRQLMTPYVQALAWERNASNAKAGAEGASPLCAKMQHVIAGLSEADDAHLNVIDTFHVSSPHLEHCHPNYTKTPENHLLVYSCSHTDAYPDFDNTGSMTAASEVACKMLSSDRVAQQLKTKALNSAVDCSKGNELVVQIAESLAFSSTMERYKTKGRGWCFKPDTETFSDIGPLWVFKDKITEVETAKCMEVSSASLKTAIDGKIYPGNTYCKFLSPARVLDWMMTDSLKPFAGKEQVAKALFV